MLADWTDSICEEVEGVVNVRLNNVIFPLELIEMRAQAEVMEQVQALPGKPPRIGL